MPDGVQFRCTFSNLGVIFFLRVPGILRYNADMILKLIVYNDHSRDEKFHFSQVCPTMVKVERNPESKDNRPTFMGTDDIRLTKVDLERS
jgi:hypothetical protein